MEYRRLVEPVPGYFDPLTKDEQLRLAASDRIGDRNRLICSCVGLVGKLAIYWASKTVADWYDELFQEGILGLFHALGKFDATRNVKFTSYARNWVNAYMENFVFAQYPGPPLPKTRRKQITDLMEREERLRGKLGRRPDDDELIATGMSARVLSNIRASILEIVELDAVRPGFREPHSSSLLVPVVPGDTESEEAAVRKRLARFMRSSTRFKGYKAEVFIAYKLGDAPRTQEEVAKAFGITDTRVWQIADEILNDPRFLAVAAQKLPSLRDTRPPSAFRTKKKKKKRRTKSRLAS